MGNLRGCKQFCTLSKQTLTAESKLVPKKNHAVRAYAMHRGPQLKFPTDCRMQISNGLPDMQSLSAGSRFACMFLE